MNLNLKQLEAFKTVVEYKNFTLASRALFLTQSTVSAHVKALEKELGTELIVRSSKKNIYITPEGFQVYEYARQILELCEQMERNSSKKMETELSIAASTIPSQFILPKAMAEFLVLYPECRFVLDQGDSAYALEKIREGKSKIGLVGTKEEGENLSYELLCRDHFVLVTQNNQKFRTLKEEGCLGKELLREPLLLRTETSGTSKEVEKYLDSQGIRKENLHIVARINDQETIKNAVMNGMGVNIVSSLSVEEEVKNGKLLAFELGEKKYYRNIYLVCQKEKNWNWMEQKFIAHLLSYVSH